MPSLIAEFLDLEEHLKRRFREDSITDILVASLLSLDPQPWPTGHRERP
nr:DUF6615 family protein [Sphingopyxis lindanitolerans]